MFTEVKTFKSEIKNTSNGYYYAVMSMSTIFYLRKGRYEPTETYSRIFEAAISAADLKKK